MTTTSNHTTGKRFYTVSILYDQDAQDPFENDQLGTLLIHEEHGDSIHKQLRGVRVAVQVDIPPSYTDRYWRRGVIYMTPEEVRKEYGADNAENRTKAKAVLEAEASEWRAWADGSVFGFILTVETECACCGQRIELNDLGNSCWGFITSDPEHDLESWMGEAMPDDHAKEALKQALSYENWTGNYPVAAKATVEVEAATA